MISREARDDIPGVGTEAVARRTGASEIPVQISEIYFLRGSYGRGLKYGRHGRFRTADLYRVKVLKPMDFT